MWCVYNKTRMDQGCALGEAAVCFPDTWNYCTRWMARYQQRRDEGEDLPDEMIILPVYEEDRFEPAIAPDYRIPARTTASTRPRIPRPSPTLSYSAYVLDDTAWMNIPATRSESGAVQESNWIASPYAEDSVQETPVDSGTYRSI